jgi:hypothetical protein
MRYIAASNLFTANTRIAQVAFDVGRQEQMLD